MPLGCVLSSKSSNIRRSFLANFALIPLVSPFLKNRSNPLWRNLEIMLPNVNRTLSVVTSSRRSRNQKENPPLARPRTVALLPWTI
jgi:hypothetical protein